jgi:hypothetical protein
MGRRLAGEVELSDGALLTPMSLCEKRSGGAHGTHNRNHAFARDYDARSGGRSFQAVRHTAGQKSETFSRPFWEEKTRNLRLDRLSI